MPLNSGTPIRLSSSNSVARFANKTPHQTRSEGYIGISRIAGLIGEIGLTILFPEFSPLILTAGAAFQESLDIYSYSQNKNKDRAANISFAASTLVNVLPLIGVARTLRTTSNVLKIADKEASTGFRYIVRGVDRDFESTFARISRSGSKEIRIGNKSISRITINKERALIAKNKILPKYQRKVLNKFEKGIQEQFGSRQAFDKVIASSGRNKYYSKKGDFIYTNKDISMLRNEVKAIALGRRSEQQVINNLKSLSSTARDALGYETMRGGRFITSAGRKQALLDRLDNLSEIYADTFITRPSIKTRPWWKRSLEWFGKDGPIVEGKRQWWKGGRFWTQAGQLTRANDITREIMNRAQGIILHGKFEFGGIEKTIFKNGGLLGYSSKIKLQMEKVAPQITKILNMNIAKRLSAKYIKIKEVLSKKGVLTRDDEFIMGWRVIKASVNNSEVLFYFNPIKTNAKTKGSKNYGGKRAVHAVVKTSHLKYLKQTDTPGHCYLKGEGGFPPIAMSAGGKRAFMFELATEALELATLYMPLAGIRNIFSLISNAKSVVKDLSQGIYFAKFGSTIRNTFTRLLPNKITRIAGKTLGGMINDEMGAHISRLFKTIGQGFQKTETSTYYKLANGTTIKGKRGMRRPYGATKYQTRKTHFSFNNKFNWRPLVKQGMPLTWKSHWLRKSPRNTPLRRNINNQRIGKNLRRPLGIIGLT